MKIKIYYVLCFAFWFANFFCSTDYYQSPDIPKVYASFQEFLNKGTALTIKQLIIFAFLGFITFNYKFHYKGKYKFFFVISVVTIVLCYLNPENFSSSINIFFNYDSVNLIIYIWFLFIALFANEKQSYFLLKSLISRGIIVSTVICFIGIYNYLFGLEFIAFNQKITIPFADILLWLAIFQIITINAFFITKKQVYKYLAVLHFVVLFLSFRRTYFWVATIVSCIIIYFHYYRTRKVSLLVRYSLIFVTAIFFLITIIGIDLDTYVYFIQRQLGVFNDANTNDLYLSDSGHLDQTLATTATLFNEGLDRFWGIGFTNAFALNVQGSYLGYVHNSYVYVWAKHGMHMTIYLFFLLVYFARRVITVFKNLKDSHNFNMIYCSAAILILFILVSGWSTPMVSYIIYDITFLSQFVLLVWVFRISKNL